METIDERSESHEKSFILLIEDEPVVLKAHKFFLEKLGYIVELASTGKEALEKFKKYRFDAILLDYGLPDISGIEICKQIRMLEQVNYQSETPAIMITAYNIDDLLEKECFEVGVNEISTKPITLGDLNILLSRWIKKSN